jgi:CRISPR/Cas system endoribonuclease Cas6 (RAMP superfamily)
MKLELDDIEIESIFYIAKTALELMHFDYCDKKILKKLYDGLSDERKITLLQENIWIKNELEI